LLCHFKNKSREFNLYLFIPKRGQSEGKVRAKRGQGEVHLSLPSLCPLYAHFEMYLCRE